MNKLDELLINYNILPGHRGYFYIKWILENITENIAKIKITELYKQIANEFDVTSSSVERCIRYCVDNSNINILKRNKIILSALQMDYKERIKYE